MAYLYTGQIEKKHGHELVLMKKVENGGGMSPLLVRGKYGYSLPYVSNNVFAESFANLKYGVYVELIADVGSGFIRSVSVVSEG